MADRRWKLGSAAIGVLVVVGGVAGTVASQASGVPSLPAITPERLIASTVRALAQRPPISGHVAAYVDLGIPSLPAEVAGASGPAGFLASLAGDHSVRVWRSADGFRMAELQRASERALFVSRTDAWAWDFSTFTAYHLARFPAGAVDGSGEGADSPLRMLDPVGLAGKALDAITPSTALSLDRNAMVAGRPAYVLVLEPRTTETLVGRIEIAMDAERRIPLRAAVVPRGKTTAAVSVAFTSVSFGKIDPATYRFTPPPHARVVDAGDEGVDEEQQATDGSGPGPTGSGEDHAALAPRVFGSDWSTIVAVRTPPVAELQGGYDAGGFDLASLLPYSGPLLSIRLVDRGDHGWLVYGLVPQSALAAVEPKLN